MAEIDLPETVNEFTRICRVCLNVSDAEYYSIEDFGKVCGKSVKISELLAECTSIQVILNAINFSCELKIIELFI